ncbi:citrate synthase like protein [Babesia gibsoni]|uniref:Citrate synthase like protein n=1 Tax=Babesia gibsoni TaxID=33632 RepID=A0AAD8PGL5_BABGI|nr:citrate synthase like protein [Babesia gibsoni]
MMPICHMRRAMSTVATSLGKSRHRRIVSVETEIYSPRMNNDIYYRGYSLRELTKKCSVMEVAHLLIKGNIPSGNELPVFGKGIHGAGAAISHLSNKLKEIIPSNAHVVDAVTAGLSMINATADTSVPVSVEGLLGECLSLISGWACASSISEVGPDNVIPEMLSRAVCQQPWEKLEEETKHLLNTIAILYMEHGLTNSSYAARLCISEGGTPYSAIITAASTHRSCMPMFSWSSFDHFIASFASEKQQIVATLKEGGLLPKPFRDFVLPDSDPRTEVLLEHCNAGIVDNIKEIEECFEGRCHLRFDVFVYSIFKSISQSQSDDTIKCLRSMLMIPRIVGWISHIAEQQKIKRHIEHLAAYVGPHPRMVEGK